MNTIADYELAQLAEATYANLLNDSGGQISGQDELKKRLTESGLSATQAETFALHWQVVHHLPNTDSGFSGAVFRRIDTDPVAGYQAGDLVFALRGTEGVRSRDLWLADIHEIVGNGLAYSQIIDMYNYWQRLITPTGELAKQAMLVLANNNTPPEKIITTDGGLKYTINFVNSGAGLGLIGMDDHLLASTGHSLGGHLATAFTRLFSGWTNQAITINGAGYPTGSTPGLNSIGDTH